MTRTFAVVSAVALIAGFGATQAANAAVKHPAQVASKAQLAREHQRAVKAGDTANDPMNSSSSDSLNQQQLAKAQAQPGMASGSADVQPGAVSGTDANSGAMNTSGADATTPSSQTPDTQMPTTGNATDSNTMPPASPPVNGTTPQTQNTPQAGNQGATPDTSNPNSGTSSPQ